MPTALPPPPRPNRLPLLLLALGIAGAAAGWIVVATATGGAASWVALVAAADAAFLLRIGRMPPGPRRAAWAAGATLATIVLAQWGIVAAGIGQLVGLGPVESALRLGPGLAWTVVQLLNGPMDLALLATSVLLAALAAR